MQSPAPVTRIMVMGAPGSGKSTLARRLGAALGVPVTHLDALYHDAGWRPRPIGNFAADLAQAAAGPGWVIDGNYTSMIEGRRARADMILLLEVPRRVRMTRILRRVATGYGKVRVDSAPGCPERFDPAFLLYAWTWDRAVRPRIEAALAGHGSRIVRLTDRPAIDALVSALSFPARASGL